jgi:hypothetical protein
VAWPNATAFVFLQIELAFCVMGTPHRTGERSDVVDRIDGESSITGWNRHVSSGLSIKGTSHCAGWIAHPWQAYNGGSNTGVFLQITCDDPADLQVPDQKCTFGVVKAAQARGDFEVLAERDRRVLRIHLGPHVAAGLTSLKDAVRQALA